MCSTFGRSTLQKLRSVTDLLNPILTKKVQHGAAFKAYFPICVTESLNLTHVGNTMLEKSLHLFGEHFLSKRCSLEKHCIQRVTGVTQSDARQRQAERKGEGANVRDRLGDVETRNWGGAFLESQPGNCFQIRRDVQVKEVPCLHISLGWSFHFVSAVDD